MKALFKTTIVIWSKNNPTDKMELSELAREAESGDSYCSKMQAVKVEDPSKDEDWDGTEFFGEDAGEEDGSERDAATE